MMVLLWMLMGLGDGANSIEAAHLRVARPTDDIGALMRFYKDGLGMVEIGSFKDHQGFDGVMVGFKGGAYHLEFTHHQGHKVGKAPTQDNLLVFYIPDKDDLDELTARMTKLGYPPVPSYNPYWDVHGKTFEDPDGYRVVLQFSPRK